MSTAESFGRHFFTCKSVPRCEIGDDPSQDYFCSEGERLKWELFRSAPDPEDRAYLLHLADDYFDEAWHRGQVTTINEKYPIDRTAALKGFVDG